MTTWTELEVIMLSQVSQKVKDKECFLSNVNYK